MRGEGDVWEAVLAVAPFAFARSSFMGARQSCKCLPSHVTTATYPSIEGVHTAPQLEQQYQPGEMVKKRWKKKGQAGPNIQADADPTTRSITLGGDLAAVAAGKRWRVVNIRCVCCSAVECDCPSCRVCCNSVKKLL